MRLLRVSSSSELWSWNSLEKGKDELNYLLLYIIKKFDEKKIILLLLLLLYIKELRTNCFFFETQISNSFEKEKDEFKDYLLLHIIKKFDKKKIILLYYYYYVLRN